MGKNNFDPQNSKIRWIDFSHKDSNSQRLDSAFFKSSRTTDSYNGLLVTPPLFSMVINENPIANEEEGDLHPIELVAHFLLSDSLENLHEMFLLLHESQHLLLRRLLVIEEKLTNQLELAKKRDFDVALVYARLKAVNKKVNETRQVFDLVEKRLDRLEDNVNMDESRR